MPDRSPELDAAVRAVRGESDLDAVLPALADAGLARVIACAPETHHLVRAIAALCGGLPSLLDAPTRASPALHDVLRRVIGTPAGRFALSAWAEVTPAGWGRAHAVALIDAVHAGVCDPGAAAALIGPDDRTAFRLRRARDIAFAFRCWGQSDPAAPTAWANMIDGAERERLFARMRSDPSAFAFCLPWLPPDAVRAADASVSVGDALDAFAAASPTARAQHAAILQRLVDCAHLMLLEEITRLACAMQTDEVWNRVQNLLQQSPVNARLVVAAAPWDDLPKNVRAAILDLADGSDVCAAIAAACGRRDAAATNKTDETAVAFFAALDPRVWDALDADAQRQWRLHLPRRKAHLAVRALGPRPEFLARATLDDVLARAVRRHARNEDAWRAALLSVALRTVNLAAAHALIAAMPPPPDTGAFFVSASGHADPDVLAPARAALRAPADLALAVALQRCARGHDRARPACAALQDALRGRTWDDLAPIMPLLTDDARAALPFETDALITRLAHPDRQDALRQALARLAALPPENAVPVLVALNQHAMRRTDAADAAEALTDALHAHGGVFLALTDALADDDLRAALLPLPEDAALADALRGLAHDDLPTVRRLAQALRDQFWRDALLALLHAPLHSARAVWQALSDDARRAIGAIVAAAPTDADPPAVSDPIAALALAASQSERDDLRNAGRAALTAHSARIRAIWEHLPPEIQQMLGEMPAFADLSTPQEPRAIRRARRW